MAALRDRVAVVTGAASGIGRALALGLAARGADLALVDIDAAGLAAAGRYGTGVRTRHAALLGLALGLACGGPEGWTTVTAEDASFRVEMPGKAEHARNGLSTPLGQAPIEMWMQRDGKRAFVAGYTEYPESVRQHFDPDTLLDSARDGAVERVRGKLLREEPRELAGVRGRRLEIAAEGGSVRVRGDFFVQGRRLYQVLATTTPKDADSPDIERFLDSFVFLPRVETETKLVPPSS